MDIAALSMALSTQNVLTQFGTKLLSQTLDNATVSCENLTKMLEQSVNPNLGQSIDIYV